MSFLEKKTSYKRLMFAVAILMNVETWKNRFPPPLCASLQSLIRWLSWSLWQFFIHTLLPLNGSQIFTKWDIDMRFSPLDSSWAKVLSAFGSKVDFRVLWGLISGTKWLKVNIFTRDWIQSKYLLSVTHTHPHPHPHTHTHTNTHTHTCTQTCTKKFYTKGGWS